MNKDGKLVLAARVVRSSTSGFFGVVLAIYFRLLGYSTAQIGLALTASLVSSAAFTLLSSFLERRYGRKRVLLLLVSLSTLAGIIFVASTDYVGLLIAMVVGTISYTGGSGGGGPFQSLEQAIIAQTTVSQNRTMAFATFNTAARIGSTAGTLLVNIPVLFERSGFGTVDSFRVVFAITVIGTFSTLFLFLALSKDAEVVVQPAENQKPRPILSSESKSKIAKLATLIGLDSFGGGFTIQAIASLWFFAKFGTSLESLSLIFFLTGIASITCFFVSAKIANRIGLVNTMVFTHLPSNILTILIPFSPTLLLATAMFIVRGFLNQMDIAPRQSYVAAIVKPEERVAAASFTSVSSTASQAASPTISGYFMQFAATISFPFFIGGTLKSLYDIILYFNFRALKAPEEIRKPG